MTNMSLTKRTNSEWKRQTVFWPEQIIEHSKMIFQSNDYKEMFGPIINNLPLQIYSDWL